MSYKVGDNIIHDLLHVQCSVLSGYIRVSLTADIFSFNKADEVQSTVLVESLEYSLTKRDFIEL